jgi:putative ABC transport system permease protein
MSTLLQDLRYGLRMLARAPVVTSVAALSLAVGIAANTAMFALLNGFVFEPFPYHDPDRLVLVSERRPGQSVEDFSGASVGNFDDYKSAAKGLSDAMLYTLEEGNLTGLDVPEQLNVVVATPNLFDVLGVQPMLGRGFRPEEGAAGRGNVLVLGYDYWQRRFLGDPSVLGRALTLNGTPYTVVGITPEAFDMIPANVQAYRPTEERTGPRGDSSSSGAWRQGGRPPRCRPSSPACPRGWPRNSPTRIAAGPSP